MIENTQDKTTAVLVGLVNYVDSRESLEELKLLAETAGVQTAGSAVQRKLRIDPGYYIGRGKAREIRTMVDELGANAVIFDDELSPIQQRNLESLIGVQVIDRTILILDIFAGRARSMEGKLQVELAQLQYMLPRLTGKGIELSREGGGIGTRGPGETKLETDRRRIRRRITHLKRQLESVKKNRNLIRGARKYPVVCLVGYTNSGKSTLLNSLVGSKISSADRLFETLDTTTRGLNLPDGRTVLVSDTVGFIRKLPHQLIDAFKATLDEVRQADLLIHVVDGSDEDMPDEIEVVNGVLKEIGAYDKPMIMAVNKSDKVGGIPLKSENTVHISALHGTNTNRLVEMISAALPPSRRAARMIIPYAKAELLDELHSHGIISKEDYKEDGVTIEGEFDISFLGKLKKNKII